MDELTASIGKALAERLDDFKFVKSKWHLTRKIEAGSQSIVIEALPTSKPNEAKLSAHGHVRIDVIGALYLPHNPYLTAKDAKSHPTVVVNCDELIGDKALANGFGVDEQSVSLFVESYAQALKSDVLPWLEKYSNVETLFENLNEDDPVAWLTSDRLTRYPVLLSILAKQGNGNRFDEIAKEFLEYCENPHAQVYKPLADSTINGLSEVCFG